MVSVPRLAKGYLVTRSPHLRISLYILKSYHCKINGKMLYCGFLIVTLIDTSAKWFQTNGNWLQVVHEFFQHTLFFRLVIRHDGTTY